MKPSNEKKKSKSWISILMKEKGRLKEKYKKLLDKKVYKITN